MRWFYHIRRRGVLKGIFFVVGLILFTAQLSGKFYLLANMPLAGSAGLFSTPHHLPAEQNAPAAKTKIARLSLDKRYDLANVFDLPAPVIGAAQYSAAICQLPTLHTGNPTCGVPAITHLRGPPSPML
jgi:hypothetical protein